MKLNLNPIVITGNGTSPVIPTDTRLDATFAFNVKISAAATVQLQYTLDDVYAVGYVQSSGTWVNAGSAITASGIIQPPAYTAATAFQVVVTGSTGTVTVQGWQNVTNIT